MGILTEVLAKNWWQLKQEKVCGAVGCNVQFYSGLLPTPNTALISVNEKEKLLKEVSIMISFSHPNVMSLIGWGDPFTYHAIYDERLRLGVC